ncbi:MAG: hypothetical protein GC151_08250 [Betaproteobacteria bacterium]|nr:hypothetical protein [Betaproteobacteria bacterium]
MQSRRLDTGKRAFLAGATMAFLGVVAPVTAAEEPQKAVEGQYCETWARNGAMGAKVQRQGAGREIEYITENQLRYLLKHKAESEKLYLLKREYTPEERRFLEESMLHGYDRMDKWSAAHPGTEPDYETWVAEDVADCLKNLPPSVRDLMREK